MLKYSINVLRCCIRCTLVRYYLLLYIGTRAYQFTSDEVSCCVFSTRNHCFVHLIVLFFKKLFNRTRVIPKFINIRFNLHPTFLVNKALTFRSTFSIFNSFVRCCYISALWITCFYLTKGRVTFLRPKTIVASFLHLMVIFFKVIFSFALYVMHYIELLCIT